MKKTILTTITLVVLSLSSFAGGKNENKKLLADLQKTLKTSTQVQWISKDEYSQAKFNFNGKVVFAFYYPADKSLMGFGIHFTSIDLPKEISDAINKKYSDWSIVDVMLFIDAYASVNYFAQVRKGKANIALKITNGKAFIYDRIPSE